jgi:hypothetical protein
MDDIALKNTFSVWNCTTHHHTVLYTRTLDTHKLLLLWWREEQGRAQYNLHDLLLVNIAGSGRHKTGCGGHHKDGTEAGGN